MNLNEDVDIARRDLKSALEEIERKSFALHGLERENAALRAMLERLNVDAICWANDSCPICNGREDHTPDCALAALLKGAADENA